jgi:uncharacterized spore protein YtfJ
LVNHMSLQQYFQSIMDRLQSSASAKTVYGDPSTAEGKTIVLVAKIGYCFGVGIGPRPTILTKDGEERAEGNEKRKLAAALLIGLFLGLVIAGNRSGK